MDAISPYNKDYFYHQPECIIMYIGISRYGQGNTPPHDAKKQNQKQLPGYAECQTKEPEPVSQLI